MKSLFEQEEKENALIQIKIGLISHYFPFTKQEIIKYQSILNFDHNHFMNNKLIQWDNELVDILKDNISWSSIIRINNISINCGFLNKYLNLIDFENIKYSSCFEWSDDLYNQYADKIDFSIWLVNSGSKATIEILRQVKEKVDWDKISARISLVKNESVIEEFHDRWNWSKLSANKHLPISIDFIKKYIDKLDFKELSKNPQCIELIYKYPTSEKWNWNFVIINPAIQYNKETFEFIFYYYQRAYESNELLNPILRGRAINSFLFSVLRNIFIDTSFFLNDQFIDHIPFKHFDNIGNLVLDISFIAKHKDKIDFHSRLFINRHSHVIPQTFIENNLELFDIQQSSFYNLQISTVMINKHLENVDWFTLSGNTKFDWDWSFIDLHFDKLNHVKLSKNKGIYENLIFNKMSRQEILGFLNEQLDFSTRQKHINT